MDREFPNSANLAVLLKWHGLALYDITSLLDDHYSPSWEGLVQNEASRYEFCHRYYLLPIPKKGETLKKSFISLRAERTYPVLRIPKLITKEEKIFNLTAEKGITDRDFNCFFLNEFFFQEEALYTSSSIFSSYVPSRVAIPTPHVLDVFSNYFCLFQFTDKGTVIKIPTQNYTDVN